MVNLPELFARIPPNSLESEMALLGGLILDPRTIPEVQTLVQVGDFYTVAHAAIFASLIYLSHEEGDVNLVSLLNDLRENLAVRDAGGAGYLENLARSTPGPAGCPQWARTVRGHAITRRLIEEAGRVIYDAYSVRDIEEAHRLAGESIERLSRAAKDIDTGRSQSVGDAARDIMSDLEHARRKLSPSGFPWFDLISSGIPDKGVVTLVGHPSHGKTTFGLTLMANLSNLHGGGGMVHSVEQGPARIAGTLLSVFTGLPVHDWMNRGYVPNLMEQGAMAEATLALDRLGIVVEPDAMDAGEIYRRAVLASTGGVRRIMVDYIQDLKPMTGLRNDAEGMAESMRMLARVSTDLDMLVIVVSQLDKAARTADRAPQLNDSRGSAAIADRTDLGVTVYRPHFNDRPEDSMDMMGCERRRSLTEFAVVKNKYGPLGKVTVRFEGKSMRFCDDN